MKKNIYIILFTIAICFQSCEIDREPFDSKTVDEVFEDEQGIIRATLGNYANLKGDNPDDYGWAELFHRMVEYGGDNVSLSGVTTSYIYYWYNYNNLANDSGGNQFWVMSYKAIGGINKTIEEIEDNSFEEDQLLGENYYLRSLVYFGLVNLYGRPYTQDPESLGVPIKLNSDVEDIPARSTVREVYDQIISDLLKAESLMTEDKGAAFASKDAAKALLSRVYLYMGENEEAISYATEIIESEQYALVSTNDLKDYPKRKPEDNPETIFAVKFEPDSDYGSGFSTVGSMYSQIDNVGWGEMYASNSYLELINKNPNDARKDFIMPVYLTENGEKIPAVYWVNDDYNYVFRRTYEKGNKTFFDDGDGSFEVKEETKGDLTKHYFVNSSNEKIYVTKDFDIDKRNGYPKFYIIKASQQEGIAQLWSPVISRLGEIYLNRAEAYAKSGEDELALKDINVIRERAGIPIYNTQNDIPEDMSVLDVVLEERRLEMAFEGWRKFDIFRNNETLERRYPGSHLDGGNPKLEVSPSDPRVILFIPEQQIDIQPSLEQNP